MGGLGAALRRNIATTRKITPPISASTASKQPPMITNPVTTSPDEPLVVLAPPVVEHDSPAAFSRASSASAVAPPNCGYCLLSVVKSVEALVQWQLPVV